MATRQKNEPSKRKAVSKKSSKEFTQFQINHSKKKDDPREITNTKIGNQKHGISGGSYHIPENEYGKFLEIYFNEVLAQGGKEHFTEKQMDKGPILVDVDLRFDGSVQERLLSEDHIVDLVDGYFDVFKDIYHLDEDTSFPVYIYQKPNINFIPDKNITKDGLHIIFGINADRATQMYIRKRIVKKTQELWEDLPIINSWEDVFDEGISKGHTNWQLHGSCKPEHLSYEIIDVYDVTFDNSDESFMQNKIPVEEFDIKSNLHKLSARYRNHYEPFIRREYSEKINELCQTQYKNNSNSGVLPTSSSTMISSLQIPRRFDLSMIMNIKNKSDLDKTVEIFLENLSSNEYDLRESYEYTMCLPESYYGEGSYDKWFRVGCALRNIDDLLFIVWVAFSAQSSTFKYDTIRDLYDKWLRFDMSNPHGLTKRSIIHWAKQDALAKFKEVRESTIDYTIELTLESKIGDSSSNDKKPCGCGDFDLAMVLYQSCKDEFVCASVKSGIWYQYKNHRWVENDSGTSLRRCISERIRNLYNIKAAKLMEAQANYPEGDDRTINLQKKAQRALEIVAKLGRTTDKKNIMVEAKELFYDRQFIEMTDTNPYLLCFKNGVWDFKDKIFRDGKPEDYITKSTKIEYIPINKERDAIILEELHDFMAKLFPIEELRTYMWEHLSSTLMGTSQNQTFNNYIGFGQNGKSVLVSLMEKTLGEYKGDVPLTLMTQGRTKIGGLAPEIVALKGLRYAVMNEPSKHDRLNEGIMKQLTSGLDPIQARAPYMPAAIQFIPQFKLVVCANYLLEIKSMDHGTWRRIRVVDFLSLFTKNPVHDDPEKPYQYMLDENLMNKFESWKTVFMAMLVEKVLETNGIVSDCSIVMAASNAYKKKQDVLAEFIDEKIMESEGRILTKTTINHEFTNWHNNTYGGKCPSPKELHVYLDKQFGKCTPKGWLNISIKIDMTCAEEDDGSDIDEGEIPDNDDL